VPEALCSSVTAKNLSSCIGFVSGHAFRRAVAITKKGTGLQPLPMSIPIRHADPTNIVAHERAFFVTSSIAGKRNLLQSDRSARLFIDVLYHYRAQRKYLLHAFVVMPDHFHILISVDSALSIERAVQFVKGGFAFRASKEFGFRAPV
jgi:putative transposase